MYIYVLIYILIHFVSCISSHSHSHSHKIVFGLIVTRVILVALWLIRLFRAVLVRVAVDHGSHLQMHHALDTQTS